MRNTPVVGAFGILGVLALVSYLMIREKAARYQSFRRRCSTFAFAFIDSETDTDSLSRLQLIAWIAAAMMAYRYVGASECLMQWPWQLPKVPDGLAPLLGGQRGDDGAGRRGDGGRRSKGAGPAREPVAAHDGADQPAADPPGQQAAAACGLFSSP
jgi:hypothetical protein